MSITREELVRIARTAVSGSNRPSAPCEGIKCRHNMECALNVTNPAAFDPPEWVIEAMDRTYRRGYHDRMIDVGDRDEDDLPPDPIDSDAPRSPS